MNIRDDSRDQVRLTMSDLSFIFVFVAICALTVFGTLHSREVTQFQAQIDAANERRSVCALKLDANQRFLREDAASSDGTWHRVSMVQR